ncbi:radical SAM/SPASM domain-containing protein [Candidatus Omnitrophota bacterium]
MLSKVFSHNKAVRIGSTYKIHLYLPAFPTHAFYNAIDKFLTLKAETIPITIVLSITKACSFTCEHCYQKNDAGEDLPLTTLISAAQEIQDLGISLFDIEGGEPLLRFKRLTTLLEHLDDRSELWINTTGHTLTAEMAQKLDEAGLYGAMISLHHWIPEKHDQFLGRPGSFKIACDAIKLFLKTGIATVINCCPSQEFIAEGGIEKMMDLGKQLNVSFIQMIHEKPAGGWLKRGNTLMDEKIIQMLCKQQATFNGSRAFSDYPSLSMQVFESSPKAFGCTAGGVERFYLNAHGEVQPCEFLNISFGNIQQEPFKKIYNRMRQTFHKPGLHWLCNTENDTIARFVKEHNITSFPIKKEYTNELLRSFKRGNNVKLYEEMKLYEHL